MSKFSNLRTLSQAANSPRFRRAFTKVCANIVRAKGGSEEEVRLIFQMVITAALSKKQRDHEPRNLMSYFSTMASNKWNTYLRFKNHDGKGTSESAQRRFTNLCEIERRKRIPEDDIDPLIKAEVLKWVRTEAYEGLTKQQTQILDIMRDFGTRVEQVAEIVRVQEVSVTTAYNRRDKCLEELQRRANDYFS